ncbi:MAG: hypothetical protein EBV77_07800 [Gemmatimonadaceae bacterium]|nr:hypothetical protein [Gemmatimonadaceae bacterium]
MRLHCGPWHLQSERMYATRARISVVPSDPPKAGMRWCLFMIAPPASMVSNSASSLRALIALASACLAGITGSALALGPSPLPVAP